MKIDRHGKAKVLSQAEIQLLFGQGLQNNRDCPSATVERDRTIPDK